MIRFFEQRKLVVVILGAVFFLGLIWIVGKNFKPVKKADKSPIFGLLQETRPLDGLPTLVFIADKDNPYKLKEGEYAGKFLPNVEVVNDKGETSYGIYQLRPEVVTKFLQHVNTDEAKASGNWVMALPFSLPNKEETVKIEAIPKVGGFGIKEGFEGATIVQPFVKGDGVWVENLVGGQEMNYIAYRVSFIEESDFRVPGKGGKGGISLDVVFKGGQLHQTLVNQEIFFEPELGETLVAKTMGGRIDFTPEAYYHNFQFALACINPHTAEYYQDFGLDNILAIGGQLVTVEIE